MQPRHIKQDQNDLFRSRLSQQLNPEHALLQLGRSILWQRIENELHSLFTEKRSRPPHPVRLVVGLLILESIFPMSDEKAVDTWIENPYWQSFCGYDFLEWESPLHPNSLRSWRKRIGASRMQQILSFAGEESLKISSSFLQEWGKKALRNIAKSKKEHSIGTTTAEKWKLFLAKGINFSLHRFLL